MNNQRIDYRNEESCRKFLLLDKIRPKLKTYEKVFIFNQGFCWDILLKEYRAPYYAYIYCCEILKTRDCFLEKYIIKDAKCAMSYAANVIKGRWYEAEDIIFTHPWKDNYINFVNSLEI